jgi:hypothetical protein
MCRKHICQPTIGHPRIERGVSMNEGRINSTPDDEIYTPAYAVKVLLPISTLEGVYRSTLFQKYNLEVLVLDKRINFQGQRKGN